MDLGPRAEAPQRLRPQLGDPLDVALAVGVRRDARHLHETAQQGLEGPALASGVVLQLLAIESHPLPAPSDLAPDGRSDRRASCHGRPAGKTRRVESGAMCVPPPSRAPGRALLAAAVLTAAAGQTEP